MNTSLLVANLLTALAFLVHTFVGDQELKLIKPDADPPGYSKTEKWTMVRCGWHWISVDLLLASIGLSLLNFTSMINQKEDILRIGALYFFVYAVVWLFIVIISKQFRLNYLKLGQWALLLTISALLYTAS